jgi:tetratricopeptide (TPR) repeat protein
MMLLAKGQSNRAAECLQRAITLGADFIEGYNNLARAYIAEREVNQALRLLTRALAVRETVETKTLFVTCLRSLRSVSDAEEYRDVVVRALSEPWGRR